MEIFYTPILQLALSIIICWALFAVLCSMIHESIVRVKSERGRYFKEQLLNQLKDLSNDINWGTLLYSNPNIELLSRSYNKPPSEISAQNFAESLIVEVSNSYLVKCLRTMNTEDSNQKYDYKYRSEILNNLNYAVNNLAPSDVVSLLKQSLVKAELSGYDDEDYIYNQLINSIKQWYNELIDRMSIWYQKKTRVRLVILGFVLAIILNVDSINMFNYFKQNPQAREAVITIAQQKMATTKPDNELLINQLKVLEESFELPIGWSIERDRIEKINLFSGNWFKFWLLKLISFLITAFAASAGAPFWFDVLKKIISNKNNNL